VKLLVITPTLGRSPFLREALDSVAALAPAVRHVLVAPGAAAAALQRDFPAVEVISDDQPGVYAAINRGFLSAGGDWDAWTWLNDDDRWRPDGMRGVLAAMANDPAAEIVYGRVGYIDAAGRPLGALPVERAARRFPLLLAAGISPFSQHGTLVRRGCAERLGPLDIRLRLGADFDYWVRAVAARARFRFVNAVVAHYRIRPGQLSGDTTAMRREIAACAVRAFGTTAAWRVQAARFGFRLRRSPGILERFLRTGCWRTETLFRRATETKGTP